MLYVSDESLNSTPEIIITLRVNSLNLNELRKEIHKEEKIKRWACRCYCLHSACSNNKPHCLCLGMASTFPSTLILSSQNARALEKLLRRASVLRDPEALAVIIAWPSRCLGTRPQPSPAHPVSSPSPVLTLSFLGVALAISCLRAADHVVL